MELRAEAEVGVEEGEEEVEGPRLHQVGHVALELLLVLPQESGG